jgi:hypothetical protein
MKLKAVQGYGFEGNFCVAFMCSVQVNFKRFSIFRRSRGTHVYATHAVRTEVFVKVTKTIFWHQRVKKS